jgi:hypothetical protein
MSSRLVNVRSRVSPQDVAQRGHRELLHGRHQIDHRVGGVLGIDDLVIDDGCHLNADVVGGDDWLRAKGTTCSRRSMVGRILSTKGMTKSGPLPAVFK